MVPCISTPTASMRQASIAMSCVAAASAGARTQRARRASHGESRSRRVIHDERRVIGESRVLEYECALQDVAQSRRDHLVVDAPADVLGVRLPAIAPPRIGFAFRGRI